MAMPISLAGTHARSAANTYMLHDAALGSGAITAASTATIATVIAPKYSDAGCRRQKWPIRCASAGR